MSEYWDGYPQNPEQDGWHWIAGPDGEPPVAVIWYKPTQHWVLGAIGMPPSSFAGANYLGPCLTPAEVEVRVAAARRGGIEAAAREMECGCPDETKTAVLEALRDGHNSVKRWQACGHSQCSTIDAFNIRALLEDGR